LETFALDFSVCDGITIFAKGKRILLHLLENDDRPSKNTALDKFYKCGAFYGGVLME
jgi:hypothetical protein